MAIVGVDENFRDLFTALLKAGGAHFMQSTATLPTNAVVVCDDDNKTSNDPMPNEPRRAPKAIANDVRHLIRRGIRLVSREWVIQVHPKNTVILILILIFFFLVHQCLIQARLVEFAAKPAYSIVV